MSGNTIGKLFTVSSFGESHGPALGCIIDGCPPGLALSEADIQVDLDRRKPGTSRFTTQRREDDKVDLEQIVRHAGLEIYHGHVYDIQEPARQQQHQRSDAAPVEQARRRSRQASREIAELLHTDEDPVQTPGRRVADEELCSLHLPGHCAGGRGERQGGKAAGAAPQYAHIQVVHLEPQEPQRQVPR